MNEIRVKLTYTFSAAGTMAPIFISILGLTEKEMPEDKQIAMKIEGLSIGGGGVTVGTKQCGFLLLMRGQKDSNKIRYNYYCDNIFLPFVQQSGIQFGGWEYGTPIPHNLKAVSW